MERYFGLIEGILTFVIVGGFAFWQLRQLKRDEHRDD
jgi:hypothetical protein